MRSVIQKLLNVTFRARWGSDALQGKERMPRPLWLSYRECVAVARTVFGSDEDPMHHDFMAMLQRSPHLVGAGGKKRPGGGYGAAGAPPGAGAAADTRRIEVSRASSTSRSLSRGCGRG